LGVRVNVVCRNFNDDRVLPRFARYLRQALGWELTRTPNAEADVIYWMGYFEAQLMRQPAGDRWLAAYFTHREEWPVNNSKAELFDELGRRVDLRVVMCRKYGQELEANGPTAQPPLPVERERFRPVKRSRRRVPVAGMSGYTYPNGRKGNDLVRALLQSNLANRVEWRASGRGWPVQTQRYTWEQMPRFYQELDLLVCPSRVEGGPMPVLEALSCGVQVVVPEHVGIIDELPKVCGITRYAAGDPVGLVAAVEKAVAERDEVRPEELREVTKGYTVQAFCEQHAMAFEGMWMREPNEGIAE